MSAVTVLIGILQQLETSHVVVALITKAVSFSVFFTWQQYKKRADSYKKQVSEIKLGHFILGFRSFCDLHYRHTENMLQHYVLKRGNEFGATSIFNSSKSKVEAIIPRDMFREYLPLLSRTHAPRITATLVDALYQLKFHNEDVEDLLTPFRKKEYEATLKEYQRNIYDLTRLYDELKEYVKDKKLNREADEWVHGYLAIFDQWLRSGGKTDMSVLQNEIVVKVLELNRNHSGNPFINQTNEKSLKCELSFDKISNLDDTCRKKLQQYMWAYRKAAKITAVIGKSMTPGTDTTSIFNSFPVIPPRRRYSTRQRIMICSGLLLLCTICFLGGLYSGSRPHRSYLTQTTQLNFSKETGDTSLRNIVSYKDTMAAANLPVADSAHTVHGLDISKYQGNLLQDIARLDPMHFIICKATEGISFVDSEFEYNWKQIKKLNLVRGAYHFYVAGDDPVQQAKHFLKTIGPVTTTDIPPVLDIEYGSLKYQTGKNDSLQMQLLAFLNHIEEQTGRKPVIYTSLAFANNFLRKKIFGEYPLWLAEYSRRSSPLLPVAWKEKGHTFWQKTDTFTIDSRRVDFDIFNGNGKEFIRFITYGPLGK